ncbi:MAG: polysaccharide deacetylase family protein [Clostridia bacterium]|nr:polysaccharide deacetylase family protein [Clostridia bacterium]
MRRRTYLPRPVLYRLLSMLLAVLFLSLPLASCSASSRVPSDSDTLPVFNWMDGDTNGNGNGNGNDGDGDRPRVALTFDDGPNHNENRTKNYVDELNKYGYHATFFVVGKRVNENWWPEYDAVKYAVENGMEIGIHGYSHDVYYTDCTEAEFLSEMNRTAEEIHKQVPDYEIKLMRPIGGDISAANAAICPYAIIHWSLDSKDYEIRQEATKANWDVKVNEMVEQILSDVEDGDIILMHDIYEFTYDATVILLERLNEMGYDVVTVSELLGQTQAGKIYHSEYN